MSQQKKNCPACVLCFAPSPPPFSLQVVRLDALGLAPAAVQAAVQKRREEQRRSEAAWEQLLASGIGGGGTHVTTEVKCPQCGGQRAQVHTILSGGTYAQERQTIQKYVCQLCSFTWRNE